MAMLIGCTKFQELFFLINRNAIRLTMAYWIFIGPTSQNIAWEILGTRPKMTWRRVFQLSSPRAFCENLIKKTLSEQAKIPLFLRLNFANCTEACPQCILKNAQRSLMQDYRINILEDRMTQFSPKPAPQNQTRHGALSDPFRPKSGLRFDRV